MKYMTIQIAIRDENRYASSTNKGMEDIDHIIIMENNESVKIENPLENDYQGFGYSKQMMMDMIIRNARVFQKDQKCGE
jgi:hypothetical protein